MPKEEMRVAVRLDPSQRRSGAVPATHPAGEWVSGDGDQPAFRTSTGAVAEATPVSRPPGSLLRTLRGLRTFDSLRVSSFRWYFLSMFGVFGAMNMQMLVRGFLVYDLTGSYTALGTIGLANAIPGLVLSLPGGVVADRWPKKLVQQVGSALNGLNALSIALLLVAGLLRFEYLLINAVIQGVIQALMMPSRQSMLSDIVYPRYIMNAVALNNLGMNLSRMVMPTIGGIILAVTDSYWAFFVMTGCYAFAVLTLIKVPSKPIEVPAEEQLFNAGNRPRGALAGGHGAGAVRRGGSAGGIGDLIAGLKYIASDRTIGVLLLINFLMVLFSMPYMQMLPGFVKDVLHGGAGMQGALMSFTSIGSVAAALVVASLPNRHRGKLLLWGGLVLGLSLVAFSASNVFWITAPVMIVLGAGQSVRMALSNALVQSYVQDEYRGRVMSIYMMEMNLVMIGAFVVSLIAEAVGPQWALGTVSMALVGLSIGSYLLLPRLRSID
jgi:MFS family permease